MTPDQLEQQSRDAVIAHLQDSSVRLEGRHKTGGMNWFSKDNYEQFFLDDYYYRIAQPKPWYRVALMKDGSVYSAYNVRTEKSTETSVLFKEWLTDRIEYDN